MEGSEPGGLMAGGGTAEEEEDSTGDLWAPGQRDRRWNQPSKLLLKREQDAGARQGKGLKEWLRRAHKKVMRAHTNTERTDKTKVCMCLCLRVLCVSWCAIESPLYLLRLLFCLREDPAYEERSLLNKSF